jgi:hypothetical protein
MAYPLYRLMAFNFMVVSSLSPGLLQYLAKP